jgi:hypothetical protein
MHNELRYQVRIHAISNKPREKKNLANFPQFFFFFFLNFKKKNNKQYGKNIIC